MNRTPANPATAAETMAYLCAIGGACLALTFVFPYGPIFALAFSPALLCLWSAALLGLYGCLRYPSARMILATLIALLLTAVAAIDYWSLAMFETFRLSTRPKMNPWNPHPFLELGLFIAQTGFIGGIRAMRRGSD